jgi:NAD(P)-dependent dehydrogenase (short-subunit alcohol dehydrogenase family)
VSRPGVVVTGSAQGIGQGIAERLARDGRRVWCLDVDEAKLMAVVEALRRDGGDVEPLPCDLGDVGAIHGVWDEIRTRDGSVAALVNDAGIFSRVPALEVSVGDWDRVMAVNLRGAFFMAQQAARLMVASATGGIVLSIASGQAFRPSSVGVSYAASKAALVNLTRALATEWGPLGIRVNTVVPGLTDTAQPRAAKGDADFVEAAAATPLRRLGTPADVAALVSFLLSDEAAYVTGQAFAVNGGRVMI